MKKLWSLWPLALVIVLGLYSLVPTMHEADAQAAGGYAVNRVLLSKASNGFDAGQTLDTGAIPTGSCRALFVSAWGDAGATSLLMHVNAVDSLGEYVQIGSGSVTPGSTSPACWAWGLGSSLGSATGCPGGVTAISAGVPPSISVSAGSAVPSGDLFQIEVSCSQ